MSKIWITATELRGLAVYVAHEHGKWGPENNGTYINCPLTLNTARGKLEIGGSFLAKGEEFKLVVPGLAPLDAIEIYNTRLEAGVHVGTRFDYDLATESLWLLAESHDVVRLGEWNQNNIYR